MTWEERSGWRDNGDRGPGAWSTFMRGRRRYAYRDGLRGIDIDWVEYCRVCHRIVLVCETKARTDDVGLEQWAVTRKLAGGYGALAGLVQYAAINDRVVCLRAVVASVDLDGEITGERVVVGWDDPPERWHDWCHDKLLPWHLERCVSAEAMRA